MRMNAITKKLTHRLQQFINRPWIIFFFVTVFITFPLWQKGYLFLFDWNVAGGAIMLWQHSIAQMFIIFLGSIFDYALFQKILCFCILYLLGVGGFLFAQEIIDKRENTVKAWVSYISGLFMVVNPFVYARTIDGQWFVMFGMIFILYMIIYLLRWYRSQRRKDIIYAIIYATLTVMISHHAVFFVSVIFFSFFLLLFWEKRDKKIFLWAIIFLVSIFIVNINIILGYTLELSPNSIFINQFDHEHLQSFATIHNGHASIYTNVLSLHGYWGEREGRFLSTQEYVYIWKPIFFVFLVFVLIGAYLGRKKFAIIFLMINGVVSYILAMGVKSIFGPLSQFLYTYVPFYIGLREPHKWVSIFVICFCGVMIYGLYRTLILTKEMWLVHVVGIIFVVFIIFYTPTMFFGFYGQMKPEDFPQEWSEAKEKINCEYGSEKVLFLPWHQYMKMDFLQDKKVANPAQSFFGPCVLSGDNLELNGSEVQKHSEQMMIVKKYFDVDEKKIDDCEQFFSDMKILSVKYIILSKSEDYNKYLKLDESICADKIKNGTYINIYEVVN